MFKAHEVKCCKSKGRQIESSKASKDLIKMGIGKSELTLEVNFKCRKMTWCKVKIYTNEINIKM